MNLPLILGISDGRKLYKILSGKWLFPPFCIAVLPTITFNYFEVTVYSLRN